LPAHVNPVLIGPTLPQRQIDRNNCVIIGDVDESELRELLPAGIDPILGQSVIRMLHAAHTTSITALRGNKAFSSIAVYIDASPEEIEAARQMHQAAISEFSSSGKLAKSKLQNRCATIAGLMGGNYFADLDLSVISSIAPSVDRQVPAFRWPLKVWNNDLPFPWEKQVAVIRALLALRIISIANIDPIQRCLTRYNRGHTAAVVLSAFIKSIELFFTSRQLHTDGSAASFIESQIPLFIIGEKQPEKEDQKKNSWQKGAKFNNSPKGGKSGGKGGQTNGFHQHWLPQNHQWNNSQSSFPSNNGQIANQWQWNLPNQQQQIAPTTNIWNPNQLAIKNQQQRK